MDSRGAGWGYDEPSDGGCIFSSTSISTNLDQASDKTLQLDLVQVHLLTELLSEKMASYASRRGEKGGAAAATEEVAEMTTFDTKLTGFDAK